MVFAWSVVYQDLPSKATPMYGVWTISLRSFNIFFGGADILEHVGI